MQMTNMSNFARLLRRRYQPQSKPEECENKSKDYLLILPVRHGRVWLAKDDTVLFDGQVSPGLVRFVRPGEYARIHAAEPFESAVLRIPATAIALAASANGVNDVGFALARIPAVVQARYDIQRLVPLLGTAVEASGPRQRLLASGIAMALLGLLIHNGSQTNARSPAGFSPVEFAAVVAFAKSRVAQRLDLAEWAGCVELPVHEFGRRFQQHTGVAPYTWFLDRRVERAKQLMQQDRRPLAEVALDAGFCSQSHFTETFHRRVGTSPGRWRSRLQES
jgi:AraC family transcriptional regulator